MLKLIRTAAAIPLIAFAGVMAGPATADDHSPGQGRIVEPGAAVLVKGSRVVGLEAVARNLLHSAMDTATVFQNVA